MSQTRVESVAVGVGIGAIVGSALLGHRLKWNAIAKGLLVSSALFTLGAAIKFSASHSTVQKKEKKEESFKGGDFTFCQINEKGQWVGKYGNKVSEDYLVEVDMIFSVIELGVDFEHTKYELSSALFENPMTLMGSEFEKEGYGKAVKSLKGYFNVMRVD
ncbi:MAG: hypothetical protein JSR80_03220 [Verrucomicrobia bacterium]|nr:hypothetical protein [Verrucomicrobiota bacterium]